MAYIRSLVSLDIKQTLKRAMKRIFLISVIFTFLFSCQLIAQKSQKVNLQSLQLNKGNQLVDEGIASLKKKDSVKAFANIYQAETFLPNLTNEESNLLKEKITSFYLLLVRLNNPATRGVQDEKAEKIQNLMEQIRGKAISKIGEGRFFNQALNLAIQTNNKQFIVFAKTRYVENLIHTGKLDSAIIMSDSLSYEPSLTDFEKMHILSLLVINSIKLNQQKNITAYFNQLISLNNASHGKIDQIEFLLANAWYFDFINDFKKATKKYQSFLAKYSNYQSSSEQTATCLIRLSVIWGKQNQKDSVLYYLKQAKYIISKNNTSKEVKTMFWIAYAKYIAVTKTKLTNKSDSTLIKQLETSTKQLEYRYKLELKKQQINNLAQQRHLEQLQYTSKMQKAWIYIILLTLFLFIVTAFGVIIYLKRKQVMALKLAEIETLNEIHRNELITQIANSQREERKIIAEKLHDEVGSLITLARLNLSSINERKQKDISPAKIKTANDILGYLADIIRQLSHQLMPATFTKLGFKKAVFQIVEDINAAEQIKVECIIIGFDDLDKFKESFLTHLYHNIQELFQNIIKHSGATEAILQLFEHKASINLIMEDNGNGFHNNESKNGKGLDLIKNRVELYCGTMNIEQGNNAGTTIIIDIPMKNIVNSGFENETEFSETLPG